MTAHTISEIRETPTQIRKSLIEMLCAEFFAADDEHSRLAELPTISDKAADKKAIAARDRVWRIRSLICDTPATTSAECREKARVYAVSIDEDPHFDINRDGCAREFQASLLADALRLISDDEEAS